VGKRGRVVALATGAVVLVAVLGTVLFGGPGRPVTRALGISPILGHDPTSLRDALDVVPPSTKLLSYTDWAKVRSALKDDLGTHPSGDAIAAMISKAYDKDLSSVSSIDDSAAALQEHFGFSPATIDWEAFAQGDDGATMVVHVPDDFDLDAVTNHLEDLGFGKPRTANGVWSGGTDLVAAIDPTITPELQYVAVLADQHLIITSDTESYAKTAVAVALGDKESLGDVQSATDIVDPLAEPAAAIMWTRDYACDNLSVGSEDQATQDQAAALIAKAGKVTPLSGLVMELGADRRLTVAELFESGDDAKSNLATRAKLAVGEAPGRGDDFSDDLTLISSKTDGSSVHLVFKPHADNDYPLSGLDSGPVLFATC
jgi:hypothetical protein